MENIKKMVFFLLWDKKSQNPIVLINQPINPRVTIISAAVVFLVLPSIETDFFSDSLFSLITS